MSRKTNEKCCHLNHYNLSNNTRIKKILEPINRYKPLIIIIIFCFMISICQINFLEPKKLMYYIMGYFFIFLSLFKFLDLKSFVDGLITYDLLAKRIRGYGYLYPCLEFSLGLAYLAQYNLLVVNWTTLILMVISGISVFKSVISGQKVKCACLGATLDVPLSTISVLENFVMGAMAAYNLMFS